LNEPASPSIVGTTVTRPRRRPVTVPVRPSATRLSTALVALLVAGLLVPAGVGASSGTVASTSPTPAGRLQLDATSGYLEGIDVSHWQSTINWAKVAAAGKTFAIIKASESTDYVDPLYGTNRANAQANGIWTGAYHFARPDASANDAVLEADHFVATIQLGRGDLIPALDLEQSGGLSISALQTWVTAWLNEVTTRVGIRPMIYTSPAFWKKYMGDSRALADAGYKTLWIAHWNVTAPTIPASNWGGHGWTFWQYSNCGTVSGISGCVDLDRYNGTDVLPQAFSSFKLTATNGGQIKQGRSGSSTLAIARTNFAADVDFAVAGLPPGATASFDPSPTALNSSAMTVTTDAGVTPTGSYPLTITGTGDGLSRTTKLTLVVTDGLPPTLVAPTMWLEPNSVLGSATMPVYVVWSATDPSGVSSVGLQRSINSGSWTTVSLPTAMTMRVWQGVPFNSTVVQRARATDKLANTSAWTPGPTASALITQQTATSVHYTGTWTNLSTSAASGGNLRYASAAGASATYTFSGSSVGWVATRGPSRGSAKVYVDGAYAGTMSLYSSRWQLKSVVFARNWGAVGSHTLKIVVSGTPGHPYIDVDAFIRLIVR
jgi:GH25 family lysozyme M1 (1,4-beta-N-acetylmuramidase)